MLLVKLEKFSFSCSDSGFSWSSVEILFSGTSPFFVRHQIPADGLWTFHHMRVNFPLTFLKPDWKMRGRTREISRQFEIQNLSSPFLSMTISTYTTYLQNLLSFYVVRKRNRKQFFFYSVYRTTNKNKTFNEILNICSTFFRAFSISVCILFYAWKAEVFISGTPAIDRIKTFSDIFHLTFFNTLKPKSRSM